MRLFEIFLERVQIFKYSTHVQFLDILLIYPGFNSCSLNSTQFDLFNNQQIYLRSRNTQQSILKKLKKSKREILHM